MSATNTTTLFAALVFTAIIHTILDPIITKFIAGVGCGNADCITGVNYYSLLWDNVLWVFLILIVMWYLVSSVREQGTGGMFR